MNREAEDRVLRTAPEVAQTIAAGAPQRDSLPATPAAAPANGTLPAASSPVGSVR